MYQNASTAFPEHATSSVCGNSVFPQTIHEINASFPSFLTAYETTKQFWLNARLSSDKTLGTLKINKVHTINMWYQEQHNEKANKNQNIIPEIWSWEEWSAKLVKLRYASCDCQNRTVSTSACCDHVALTSASRSRDTRSYLSVEHHL